MLLDGNGVLLTNDAYLTLSFADDGVSVAGQANAIGATFNAIATESVWQDAILRAFYTWSSLTNADIGVVEDGGQAFGTPGSSRGDTRFGDIRIAAIAMDPMIGAVSVPIDGVVGGTWLADVMFNTNFPFQSVDDIFAIALHEAGNVFGLDDNNDPLSPLHAGTIPTATVPTLTDTENLQALFGTRVPDESEFGGEGGAITSDNNSFANATQLNLNEYNDDDEGSAPSIVYGDVTHATDIDFFHIEAPDDYLGQVTIRVRTRGISLLAPKVSVYNDAQELVLQSTSTSTTGDQLTIVLPSTPAYEDFYIVVEAAGSNSFSIGGYSLVATFDGINQVDPAIVDRYADGFLRNVSQKEMSKLFDADDDDFFNDDLHEDDEGVSATELISESEFTIANRFEVLGSISDQTDSDYYLIRAPNVAPGQADILFVTVRSLKIGQLVPKISAFDRDLNPIPLTVLANGGGELVVEVSGIEADRNYYLKVEADDPTGPFSTGNYQLTALFGDDQAALQPFFDGTLDVGTGQNVHTLYVAQPQLFHFVLDAFVVSTIVPTTVVATIYNDDQQIVHRIAAAPGDTRSQGAVLLEDGTYSVSISAVTSLGSVTVPLSYRLSGLAISDPFASDPNDQTNNPFICPDPELGGAFCYPGNVITNDPYQWSVFIESLPEPPQQVDLTTLVQLLIADWWSWVWSQSGENGPPLAVSDQYQTQSNLPLNVPRNLGVLSNDIDPENDSMTVVISSAPNSGQLQLNPDGSFQYTPAPGYSGLVQFSYKAFDFSTFSGITSVSIAIGLQGDYDSDGTVDVLDYGVWNAHYGSTTALEADGNGNGFVDASDFVIWRDRLATANTASIPGDYDRNNQVNQLDYDFWSQSYGTAALPAVDGNKDGVINAADYTIWRDTLGMGSAGGATSIAATASESYERIILDSVSDSSEIASAQSSVVAMPKSVTHSSAQYHRGEVSRHYWKVFQQPSTLLIKSIDQAIDILHSSARTRRIARDSVFEQWESNVVNRAERMLIEGFEKSTKGFLIDIASKGVPVAD